MTLSIVNVLLMGVEQVMDLSDLIRNNLSVFIEFYITITIIMRIYPQIYTLLKTGPYHCFHSQRGN